MSFSSPHVFSLSISIPLLFLFFGKQQNKICTQSADRLVRTQQTHCLSPWILPGFLSYSTSLTSSVISTGDNKKRGCVIQHTYRHIIEHMNTYSWLSRLMATGTLEERLHSRTVEYPLCMRCVCEYCVYAWSREREQMKESSVQRAHVWLNKSNGAGWTKRVQKNGLWTGSAERVDAKGRGVN